MSQFKAKPKMKPAAKIVIMLGVVAIAFFGVQYFLGGDSEFQKETKDGAVTVMEADLPDAP